MRPRIYMSPPHDAAETTTMIKQAAGDWRRHIPPGAKTHTCDLRRYRGPWADHDAMLLEATRALGAFDRARDAALRKRSDILVVRLGARTPRRAALHALMRGYLGVPAVAKRFREEESRFYTDRLVLTLRMPARRTGRARSD